MDLINYFKDLDGSQIVIFLVNQIILIYVASKLFVSKSKFYVSLQEIKTTIASSNNEVEDRLNRNEHAIDKVEFLIKEQNRAIQKFFEAHTKSMDILRSDFKEINTRLSTIEGKLNK